MANQHRTGMSGVTGLDATACLALLEGHGLDPKFAALFLPYVEAGLLAAIADRKEEKQQ